MNKKKINSITNIVIDSMFGALSLVLAFVSRFKIVPLVGKFVNLDFSDVPIFVLAMIFEPYHAFVTLLSVSIIRVLSFDVHSFLIFLLRFSSVVFIPFISFYRSKKKYYLVLSFISIFLYLLVRFPVSYSHWCLVKKVPEDWFFKVMVWQINFSVMIRTIISLILSKILSDRLKNKYGV